MALPQLDHRPRTQGVILSGPSEESPPSLTPEASDHSLPHLPNCDPAESLTCLTAACVYWRHLGGQGIDWFPWVGSKTPDGGATLMT